MLDPTASSTSIVSVLFNSHGLAVNEKGFEVKAPTGQISIILPESSEVIVLSRYEVTSIFSPIPEVPNSGIPAISVANLIHLVQ